MFRHEWQPAQVTVIDKRSTGVMINGNRVHEYVLEASPPGGQPFRDEASDWLVVTHGAWGFGPAAGDHVEALIDAERRKIKFDHADAAQNDDQQREQAQADWKAELHGPAAPSAPPYDDTLAAPAAAPAPASASASAATAGGASDVVQQLSTLADLHSSGGLTDEEFARAKAKLIGS